MSLRQRIIASNATVALIVVIAAPVARAAYDAAREYVETPAVVRVTTAVELAHLKATRGDFYVPMDQPLANVIAAALEPETQSSYAANHVLGLPRAPVDGQMFLPLYRLPSRLAAPTVVFFGE